MKTIVKFAILALVVHALYRFVPVYLNYQQFKDAVKETALFSSSRTIPEITDRVMELAVRFNVPVDRESIVVTRQSDRTYIELAYVEEIEWLPTYRRPWQFEVRTEGWQAGPSTTGGR